LKYVINMSHHLPAIAMATVTANEGRMNLAD